MGRRGRAGWKEGWVEKEMEGGRPQGGDDLGGVWDVQAGAASSSVIDEKKQIETLV